MTSGKVYIHATNVHQGGGKSLLSSIIQSLPISCSVVLQLDSRMPLPEGISNKVKVKKVLPSILNRVLAERWLLKNVLPQDVVICFGNLPPLFKLRGHTVVYVQNRYLVDNVNLNGFSFKVRLRLSIERLWLSTMLMNADEYLVQTPTMKKLLDSKAKKKISTHILPFAQGIQSVERTLLEPIYERDNKFDFVYVASGEPHKNHSRLIDSWCLLAKEGLYPSLCLTLDEIQFSTLYSEIELKKQQYRLKLTNVGVLSSETVIALYKKSGASIYPSTFESLGLPLLEARQMGLPIVASELDYVRDVLDPEETFDPESALSIARAVKRFMGKEEMELPMIDVSDFIQIIFKTKALKEVNNEG